MRFSRECRLRKSSEFIRLRREGKWLPGRYFHVQACERDGENGSSRLGLSVSKRIGPAVVRNLVKRRFREIFREMSSEFSTGLDVVIIARRGVDDVPFADLKQQVAHRLKMWRHTSPSE